MIHKIVSAITAVLITSGCVTTAAILPNGDNVALGQTAIVDGPKILPLTVLEDSRCPINARCIRAGQVKVRMAWVRPSGNQVFEIIMGQPLPLADGTLELTSVSPGKMAGTGKEIKPKDYRFALKFSGGL